MMIEKTEWNDEIQSLAEIASEEFDYSPIEAAHELADGHKWVIYTAYHTSVIDHTFHRTNVSKSEFQQWLKQAADVDHPLMYLAARCLDYAIREKLRD